MITIKNVLHEKFRNISTLFSLTKKKMGININLLNWRLNFTVATAADVGVVFSSGQRIKIVLRLNKWFR